MVQLTTQDVTVSAESAFQAQYSDPSADKFIYAYRIQIKNAGTAAVQLLSRAWVVIDATGERRFVEGEGVVGKQPEIMPGQVYEYTSWVQFATPMGGMLRHSLNGQEEYFSVKVPRFLHIAPELLN